jgi:hypothetical protein
MTGSSPLVVLICTPSANRGRTRGQRIGPITPFCLPIGRLHVQCQGDPVVHHDVRRQVPLTKAALPVRACTPSMDSAGNDLSTTPRLISVIRGPTGSSATAQADATLLSLS